MKISTVLCIMLIDSYTLFDVSGREADCAELAPGTYFIKTDKEIMHKVVLVR